MTRLLVACIVIGAASAARAQGGALLPQPLHAMIEAERAFAARALAVGWKQASLEYLADDAVGFEKGQAGLAKDQIAARPDPPPDLQRLWEPRYGDVASSGELGYLIGPVRTVRASRDRGRPRHSVYTSIWIRDRRGGAFKVAMSVETPTPAAAPFPPGFTRAPSANRFAGDYNERTPPLATAEQVMNSSLRSNRARAYREFLASGARLHRPNVMPLVGPRAIVNWASAQPRLAAADSRYAEAAQSGDLGYTWGTYAVAAPRGRVEQGLYLRVWVRERSGQWKVALDLLQPQ